MFGNYRTVKIKVPRSCCPWCQAQTEILQERVRTLEEKIAHLEASLAFRQHTVLLTIDGGTGRVLETYGRGIELEDRPGRQADANGYLGLESQSKEPLHLAPGFD